MTGPDASPAPPRIAAIVPVGALGGAKSRLGGWLDAEERQDLVETFLARTIAVAVELQAAGRLADVVVISPDREVLARASRAGARTLRQRSRGLNQGLVEARDDVAAGGADALLILPIDLPLITADAVRTVCDALDGSPSARRPRHRPSRDRNECPRTPPAVGHRVRLRLRVARGTPSRGRRCGATYLEVGGPLAIDLDTPDDLLFIESAVPEAIGVR